MNDDEQEAADERFGVLGTGADLGVVGGAGKHTVRVLLEETLLFLGLNRRFLLVEGCSSSSLSEKLKVMSSILLRLKVP